MIDVLDALLLVLIFVELLYAVRSTLEERQIVAEPYPPKGPELSRATVEIGVLAALVLVRSGSAVLLRAEERETEGDERERRRTERTGEGGPGWAGPLTGVPRSGSGVP